MDGSKGGGQGAEVASGFSSWVSWDLPSGLGLMLMVTGRAPLALRAQRKCGLIVHPYCTSDKGSAAVAVMGVSVKTCAVWGLEGETCSCFYEWKALCDTEDCITEHAQHWAPVETEGAEPLVR